MKQEKFAKLRINIENDGGKGEKVGKNNIQIIEEEVEQEETYMHMDSNLLMNGNSEKFDIHQKKEEYKISRDQQRKIKIIRKKLIPKEVENYIKKPISIKPMYGEPLLNRGDVLDKKWKVKAMIGEGTFGQIYIAENINNPSYKVAIKCEPVGKHPVETLRVESIILKKTQESDRVPRFVHAGITKQFRFLIMGVCGQNLHYINISERFNKMMDLKPEEEHLTAELMSPTHAAPTTTTSGRRMTAKRKLPMGVALEYGIQMLQCIKSFHELGFLHRDIKPSNFVINSANGQLMLIDFNLARRFVNSNGEMKPPREHTGFRGTGRYASIKAHLKQDLGRVDDLWSLFYSMIELAGVYLPWSQISDYDEILELKEEFHHHELVNILSSHFSVLMDYLKTLRFEDEPDYAFVETIFKKAMLCHCGLSAHSAPASPLVSSEKKRKSSHSSGRGIRGVHLPLSPLSRLRRKRKQTSVTPTSKKTGTVLFPPIHSPPVSSTPKNNRLLPSLFSPKKFFSKSSDSKTPLTPVH